MEKYLLKCTRLKILKSLGNAGYLRFERFIGIARTVVYIVRYMALFSTRTLCEGYGVWLFVCPSDCLSHTGRKQHDLFILFVLEPKDDCDAIKKLKDSG